MTRYYFWISYDIETAKYKISGSDCSSFNSNGRQCLQILRDFDFNKKIKLGDRIKIHLVSYPRFEGVRMRDAQKKILESLKESNNDNMNVKIEKTIDVVLPDNIKDFNLTEPLDDMRFDMEGFNLEKEFSNCKMRCGDFSLSINHHRKITSVEEYDYFTFSHPFIKL